MIKITLKNSSLRFRLIIALSLIIFLIWSITIIFVRVSVKEEVDKLFDTQQILFAERLASSNLMESPFLFPRKKMHKLKSKNFDDEALAFAIFNLDGELIFDDGRNGKLINFMPKKGFQMTHLAEEDELWRIFWLRHHDVYIAVGQELEYRQEMINDILLAQIWFGIIALPLIILSIWFIVDRTLLPLRILEKRVKRRQPDETSPLEIAQLPQEILPLVVNLNHYFTRTKAMLNRERRFTSDAAHELRSPLAGLKVQADLLPLMSDDPAQQKKVLANLNQSIDRITQLIEQLLHLSRLENMNGLSEKEVIDWTKLIETTVSEYYPLAEKKGSNIEFIHSGQPNCEGKAFLLALAISNLLRNAIYYTPDNSLIRIGLLTDRLIIEDNGAGMSEEDLMKIGQPFFRPVNRPIARKELDQGSGLGISIVKRILALHDFYLHLSHSELGGLKAEIIFSPQL